MDQRREAREAALKFLYKCELEQIYYFSGGHFAFLGDYLEWPGAVRQKAEGLARGVLESLAEIDETIQGASTSWALHRLLKTDLIVLRLAVFELRAGETPVAVVINEAIEIAERYGSSLSSNFVNGVADEVARRLKASPA